jgi:hypothetical protein
MQLIEKQKYSKECVSHYILHILDLVIRSIFYIFFTWLVFGSTHQIGLVKKSYEKASSGWRQYASLKRRSTSV